MAKADKRKNKIRKTAEDHVMDIIVTVVLIAFTLICIYPIWYVIVGSFTSSSELVQNPGFLLWPKKVVTSAYQYVFSHQLLIGAYGNTIKILLTSIPINIVLTLILGYFMACEGMFWKKAIISFVMFTMFFGGGLIPSYLNIRDLGLYNTHWAVILPGALGIGNAIIARKSIEAIPNSLMDAAYMDGANDFQIIFKVIMPLIKPTVAVLVLYYGVDIWNDWFKASIYLKENKDMPLQNILRHILTAGAGIPGIGNENGEEFEETIKYAAIIVSTVPILCVYPFLQKYFAKGALVGAVKG
ncbi:MAG: carbohydrate ABC transporter permease [Lachnospiraceae bacterium]|nr:carbohydrate ABC transporter permease [Lachnospiraceae bacterium]